MLTQKTVWIPLSSMLLLLSLFVISCSGPQPLARAIDPADRSAYLEMIGDAGQTPGEAFIVMKASDLGISVDEARIRDERMSAKKNPFHARSDRAAVSRGAMIYSQECLACHGEDADGRGPSMPVGMDDLDFHRFGMRFAVTLHGGAPKRWFRVIEQGDIHTYVGEDGEAVEAAMPAFGDRLAREQIWLVITYLQSLDRDLPKKAGEQDG